MLSQRLLDGLFKALDFAEEIRGTVNRLRGKPTEPPPWEVSWPKGENAAPPASAPAVAVVGEPPSEDTTSRAPRRAKPAATRKPASTAARRKSTPPAPSSTDSAALTTLTDALDRGTVPPPAELELKGKPMLGRILWALAHSQALSGHGLTGPEVAKALTHAGIKTAPNNVMRAVRQDGGELFQREDGAGRAVVLVLTDEGRRAAAEHLGVRFGEKVEG
ncbi:MAG: hypothetical protein AB2A00_16785 [Myxococcota bacterium]